MPPPRNLTLFCAVSVALLAAGCNQVSSTAKRAGVVGLGSAATAAVAYDIGHRSASTAIAGAIAGATLTSLAQGEDPDVRQAGFDDGYVHGQSDAIKRQYFLRQALEARPVDNKSSQGDTVYYLLPGPEVTVDGRKLEPHQVAVRVVE